MDEPSPVPELGLESAPAPVLALALELELLPPPPPPPQAVMAASIAAAIVVAEVRRRKFLRVMFMLVPVAFPLASLAFCYIILDSRINHLQRLKSFADN
jgi:hypothetical protein